MAGRVAGKVAFITGAARGQGRSHAIRLAAEGADIIAVDLCRQVATVPYPMSTPEDLADTVKEVEALDRRIVATQADVRDFAAVKAALDDGVAQLGRLDIVSANAGIFSFGTLEEMDDTTWQDMLDVNLTGVWHAAKAAIPHLRAAGGGSIILTSSTAGLKAIPNTGHYNSAKHGVVGLMRTLAELRWPPHRIRVNYRAPDRGQHAAWWSTSVHAGAVPGQPRSQPGPTRWPTRSRSDIVEPVDISNAILWLVSDDARYVTGITLPVDAGFTNK